VWELAEGEGGGGDATDGAVLGSGAAAESWKGSAGVATQPGIEVVSPLEVEQGIGQVFEIAEG